MAANEAQARQILPQLRFHKAENLPIFSSSHVFSDVNIGTSKKDLEGLIFGDAPWVTAEEDFSLGKYSRILLTLQWITLDFLPLGWMLTIYYLF